MKIRARAVFAILALTAVGLPFRVKCQQQGPGVRVMPIIPAKPANKDMRSDSLSDLPTLIKALGDKDWTVRAAAINALFALKPPPPNAAAAVVPPLNDSKEYVRQAAMRSLIAQTNPIVIPILDKELHDKDSYVVTEAASQIGAFGNAAAASVPRLKELLAGPSAFRSPGCQQRSRSDFGPATSAPCSGRKGGHYF
jgi:hypothetical protein